MTNDNAFSKAWKTPCTCCKKTPNFKLFFKEMCDECYLRLYKQAVTLINRLKN